MNATNPTAAADAPGPDVLTQLGEICAGQGLGGLAEQLAAVHDLVAHDMRFLEDSLAAFQRAQDTGSLVERSAAHLLRLGGKRLRPICVLLAARVGPGAGDAARELAVAVELVHSATLLHDDVVDMGDKRRHAPTSRMVYGNAASIYAGDWLLIEAIRRVRRTKLAGVLDHLLDVIDEMIAAESLQLQNRGRFAPDRETYFRVIEGKTAALFRWALAAGAKAGALEPAACAALETYGKHVGVAFQAVDDLLDFTGDPLDVGKPLFADLRDGKMTYMMIAALEREPALITPLREIADTPADAAPSESLVRHVVEVLRRTKAAEACRALAATQARAAMQAVAGLPPSGATSALVAIADAAILRRA